MRQAVKRGLVPPKVNKGLAHPPRTADHQEKHRSKAARRRANVVQRAQRCKVCGRLVAWFEALRILRRGDELPMKLHKICAYFDEWEMESLLEEWQLLCFSKRDGAGSFLSDPEDAAEYMEQRRKELCPLCELFILEALPPE
eukprot:1784481-Karenia_brevis.AAC.1